MSKLKPYIKRLKDKLFVVLKRYPVALGMLLASVIMIMIIIDINSYNRDINENIFARLAMSLFYGGILSMVIKSIAERFSYTKLIEWLSYILVPISIVLVYFLLLPDFKSMEVVLKYSLLCTLSASMFFYIPFIKSDRSASYFAQKVFLRLAITMIYYGIILGGVEAIIFAIENLLSVTMPNGIYAHTAVLIAGLFIPAFFFAGIPDKNDIQESFPKLLKLLLHYIMYILLSAYTLVLYVYFLKILFELTLPSNLLGNLVIYYSLISIVALYFGHFTKNENKWTQTFYRLYPFALIIPTLMMLLSFIIRINQYGFTEPRYFAILCVIFVLRAISVIKLQKKVKLIPLVLSILLLVSIFGPLSSFNVSKWSQNRRFIKILTKASMLKNGTIIPKPDASDESKHEITQIVSYFDNRDITSELKYVGSDFDMSEMMTYFGFDSYYEDKSENRYFINTPYEKYQIIYVKDYDYIVKLYPQPENIIITDEDKTITIKTNDFNDYKMSILVDDAEIYTISMLETLLPYLKSVPPTDENKDYEFIDETDSVSIKIIIMNAHYDEGYFYYDIQLLFSVK